MESLPIPNGQTLHRWNDNESTLTIVDFIVKITSSGDKVITVIPLVYSTLGLLEICLIITE